MSIKTCLVSTVALALAGCGAFTSSFEPPYISKAEFNAHWVSDSVILLPPDSGENPVLWFEQTSETAQLTAIDLSKNVMTRFPHLKDFSAYEVALTLPEIKTALKNAVAVKTDSGAHLAQIPGVLDSLYTAGPDNADERTDYGAVLDGDMVDFTVWAPTAQNVSVKLYDNEFTLVATQPMAFDQKTGAWDIDIEPPVDDLYYRYALDVFHPLTRQIETVETTDPYALSLSTNSEYAHVIDLNAQSSKPDGWDEHDIPTVSRPEELIIYETHIGDFSGTDETVPLDKRGSYSAFLETGSDGINHLESLEAAGLNVIHLLPTYDIGTVNENPAKRARFNDPISKACDLINQEAAFCGTLENPDQSIADYLAGLDPSTGEAQAVVEAIDEIDDFNWGYDPVHYTVPEGSYATNPDGTPRIVEFRSMVQRLHDMGFRVVMDVVYNHTFKSGLDELSVLDKIVPGYYHRLNPMTGAIEQSTCCENTATEHVMMAKLMTDSLVVWARDYKIDGFRFDLMGHQPRHAMLKAREAVRKVDPDTYFYGEGWNFGEVVNNARFRQATQIELTGTEIGTFTDRLRDAVRGGSSFSNGQDLRRGQGLGSGVVFAPNDLNPDITPEDATYHTYLDQVRIGLAGNLADFEITNREGKTIQGRDVDYGGAPAGYAADPADTINYVSKHDNQTLWDNHQYRLPYDMDTDTRVRLHLLSLSYPLYAQGIPFLHMGTEFMRSKSFLRDSYNYGHWFNEVDFAKQANNYNVGLPPEVKDGQNWETITKLLNENEGRDTPSPRDIRFADSVFKDMLKIRSSSDLFALKDGADIKQRISFLNTGPDSTPGLIAMSIDDGFRQDISDDLDPDYAEIIVVFNHSNTIQGLAIENSAGLKLHPVLQSGADPVVKTSKVSPNALLVPAWTTAIFVRDVDN